MAVRSPIAAEAPEQRRSNKVTGVAREPLPASNSVVEYLFPHGEERYRLAEEALCRITPGLRKYVEAADDRDAMTTDEQKAMARRTRALRPGRKRGEFG